MKAQITIFIIIGMVLLIAVGITLYATSIIVRNPKIIKSNVKTFVDDCLKKASETAFLDLGINGGFFSSENREFKTINNQNFTFLIKKPSHDICSAAGCVYYENPPKYPWPKFPFTEDNKKSFVGYFGDSLLPSLDEIKIKLEKKIAENLQICVHDFIPLKKQGINIKVGEPKINILFTDYTSVEYERFTTIKADWPLVESIDGQQKKLQSFSAKLPIRFSTIYSSVEFMINNDISNVSYNPQSSMNVEKEYYNGFSTISVSDSLSKIYGRDYIFAFAREDRIPALWNINLPTTNFHLGTRISINNKNELIIDDPCEDKIIYPLEASAADEKEEQVSFSVTPRKLDDLNDNLLKVTASKGSLNDWQNIPIQVTSCIR